MRSQTTLLFAAVILTTLTTALPASASSVNVVLWDSRYGTLDDTTGRFTRISTLSARNPSGIASMNGLLYLEDFGSNLYTVDTLTGSTSLVGNSSRTLQFAAFAGGSNGLFALGYDANLYAINASTAQATRVGATGLSANNGRYDTSMAFDGTNLYYTQGSSGGADLLYSINPTTGVAQSLGSTGITGVAGSAYVDGRLELYQYGQKKNYIYSAPVLTTSFTRGAQLNAQILVGGTTLNLTSQTLQMTSSLQLDVAAPEPASFLLLCVPVLVLWHRRKLLRA